MKKIFFIFGLFSVVGLQLIAQNKFDIKLDNEESKKSKFTLVTEDRNLPHFDNITVSGRFKVVLYQQNDQAVTVVAADKYISSVETTVKDGILNINMENLLKNKNANIFDALLAKYNDYLIRKPIEIHIGVKNLKTIYATGASMIETKTLFKQNDLSIQLDGASTAVLEYGIDDNLLVHLTGASKMKISGKARNIQLSANGAARFEGNNLKAVKADINLEGASKAEIYVSEALNANAGGASKLICSGNPKIVEQHTTRASDIVIQK